MRKLCEGIGGDENSEDEIIESGEIWIEEIKLSIVGKKDRVKEEIEKEKIIIDLLEKGIEGGDVIKVERKKEIREEMLGKRFKEIEKRIKMIGEGKLGEMWGEMFWNEKGKWVIVREKNDEEEF